MPVASAPGPAICFPSARQQRLWIWLAGGADSPATDSAYGRLFYLLVGAWIINFFDLGFTVLAQQQHLITELNPVAARLLNHGPLVLALYKFGLLGAGSALLWWQRRQRFTEVCLWTYCLVCVMLALRWHAFYRAAEPLWVEVGATRELLPAYRYFPVYSMSRPLNVEIERIASLSSMPLAPD